MEWQVRINKFKQDAASLIAQSYEPSTELVPNFPAYFHPISTWLTVLDSPTRVYYTKYDT